MKSFSVIISLFLLAGSSGVKQSAEPATACMLAPLFDPETGIIFSGDVQRKTMRVLSGKDPSIRIKSDLGEATLSQRPRKIDPFAAMRIDPPDRGESGVVHDGSPFGWDGGRPA